jgi:hypothetical protein
MLNAARIDHIRRVIEEGPPHMGSETEGILTDPVTLDVVHRLGGSQPATAVRTWISEHGAAGAGAAGSITADIPETTIEANPLPLRSPRSTAAAQRLFAILVDAAVRSLAREGEPAPHLLHGAAWRPPNLGLEDASVAADIFKRNYYRFQIGVHGDKVGAAAGDHLNLSAPWLGHPGEAEISRKMIEMTGRMRLVGGFLSIALSASSPLYFGADSGGHDPVYGTSLTPWESARLGHVWPGRTIMDVSGLYRDPVSFRRTMDRFARNGTLLSGRDVWLIVRAQPGSEEKGPGLEDLCRNLSLDLSDASDRARIRELLEASFRFGPEDRENGLRFDPAWMALEQWRQDRLERLIRAPRNRVEVRTLETPSAFDEESPGGAYRTPYEYIRSVHTFLELLFIHLSENPPYAEDLEYGELELQAAKSNEQAVLLGGLDAVIRWIPGNMRAVTARDLLRRLLDDLAPLARGLDREGDLQIVREVAASSALPPAARIRREVGGWYGIDVDLRHNARLLPDDEYPRMLLERSRRAMEEELEQIRADLPTVPGPDREYLEGLLGLIETLNPRKA